MQTHLPPLVGLGKERAEDLLEEGILELIIFNVVVDGGSSTDVLLELEIPVNEGGVGLVGEEALNDVVALLVLAK